MKNVTKNSISPNIKYKTEISTTKLESTNSKHAQIFINSKHISLGCINYF